MTWVRFQDRPTGRGSYFWNTHLDHQIQTAREKAAVLIRERLGKTKPGLPLLLVGDFNANATENPAHDLLVKDGGLTDTWFTAKERRNADVSSFTGFGPLKREGKRIDWILARGGLEVRASEVVTFQQKGQRPSDHFPVAAWLRLP